MKYGVFSDPPEFWDEESEADCRYETVGGVDPTVVFVRECPVCGFAWVLDDDIPESESCVVCRTDEEER
jgi:hypothetical protein